ncbi:hypothetical protein [Sinorhizobium medicae]
MITVDLTAFAARAKMVAPFLPFSQKGQRDAALGSVQVFEGRDTASDRHPRRTDNDIAFAYVEIGQKANIFIRVKILPLLPLFVAGERSKLACQPVRIGALPSTG